MQNTGCYRSASCPLHNFDPVVDECSTLIAANGIVCTAEGDIHTFFWDDVVELDGYLSSHIGMLTNLDHFALAHATLTGTLPTEIGLLTALKELTLNNNMFTGNFIPI
jgi:hypothetical protein